MARSVAKPADVQAICDEQGKAWHAHYQSHPLAGALEGLSDESFAASLAPRWYGTEKTFKNGCRRLSIRRVVPDLSGTLDRAIRADLGGLPTGLDPDPEVSEERAELNRKRAARRAKATVIDKAISAGMNALHTLTFKENVTDLDLALKCLDKFRRKCQAFLKDWRYVVCWQRQARGAWHFHLATYRLPRFFTEKGVKINSWDLMRRFWRESIGKLGGNFDEAKHKRRNGSRVPITGAARIARYIGRYIGRDIGVDEAEELKGRKTFSTSKGIDVPRPVRYVWDGEDRWGELMTWALSHIGGDERTRSCWFSSEIECFFVELDPLASDRVAPS